MFKFQLNGRISPIKPDSLSSKINLWTCVNDYFVFVVKYTHFINYYGYKVSLETNSKIYSF